MSQLAAENYGRFHKSSKNDRDIHLFAHKILTEGIQESFVIIKNYFPKIKNLINIKNFKLSHIPEFEGDDLRRLANEINKAKQFLKQCITFSKMYDKREDLSEG